MLWELALFSIFAPAAYWGVVTIRRPPFGVATYGWMLVGTAVAIAIAYLGGRSGAGSWTDALAVIGVGVGAVMLIVAPMLRMAARWAVTTDRLRLAAALVDVRDLLQPGMGGRDEKHIVATMREVKEGRVDHAVAALEALRTRAPAGAATAIDERIAALYLSAQRFEDAVRHAERSLLRPDAKLPPALCIELIGARLRLGELDAATDLAERFLLTAHDVPELVFLTYRLHLTFLAYVGRVAEVDRLLDPALAAMVSRGARKYWAGVVRHAAGDVAGARAAFEAARSLAGRDRRARAMIDLGLREVERPAAAPTPKAAAFADRLVASPITMPLRAPGRRGRVTVALIAANFAVAGICGLVLGGWGDLGSVVRVGANLRGAVEHGEPWRIASSVFVHVGYVHLLLNMLALWSLGRLVEGLFGHARMLAIYGAAGLVGAAASHAFGVAGVSAGASGAIFGLLGASLIELALHRTRYRREWRRSLLGALAFVTVAQLALGFGWEMIDQWAHVGGLVGGAAMGAALSPGWRWSDSRAAIRAAQAAAAVIVAVFAWSGIRAATTDYGDSLRALDRAPIEVGGFTVDAPVTWVVDQGELVDNDLYVVLSLGRFEGVATLAEQLAAVEREELQLAIERKFTSTVRADHVYELPEGWRGSEWIVSHTDPMNNRLQYRLLTFVTGTSTAGALYVPDVLAQGGAAELVEILATIR